VVVVEKVGELGVVQAVSGSFDYGGKCAAFAQDDDDTSNWIV